MQAIFPQKKSEETPASTQKQLIISRFGKNIIRKPLNKSGLECALNLEITTTKL
jgi:hypothetical protein